LTYTKSDSDCDYMLTVTSCEHPVTFVPLLAPNPGDATWCSIVFCMESVDGSRKDPSEGFFLVLNSLSASSLLFG